MSKVKEVLDVVLMRKPRRITREEYLAKLLSKGLHPDGQPVLDPRPLAPPIGYKSAPSMVQIVRDMVQSERLAQEAAAAGFETMEEADDFEIGDDPDQLRSQWENEFDPPIREIVQEGRKIVAEREAAESKKPPTDVRKPAKPPKADPPSDGPDPDQDLD